MNPNQRQQNPAAQPTQRDAVSTPIPRSVSLIEGLPTEILFFIMDNIWGPTPEYTDILPVRLACKMLGNVASIAMESYYKSKTITVGYPITREKTTMGACTRLIQRGLLPSTHISYSPFYTDDPAHLPLFDFEFWYCRMPNIAIDLLQVFKNTWSLVLARPIEYPPAHLNAWIHTLQIDLDIVLPKLELLRDPRWELVRNRRVFETASWRFLLRLASGSLGFENLEMLTVGLSIHNRAYDSLPAMHRMEHLIAAQDLSVKTKSLEVVFYSYNSLQSQILGNVDPIYGIVQQMTEEMLFMALRGRCSGLSRRVHHV
ncbi:hypothetical protein P154DRAFT_528755 [Amniculicola lignicola CBS 123094]|uniref:Uncharacterized protein n=1 Tax=Amniculicola lignicola CBS 123094 TaxID=1392246 RepID=A0A6A5X5J8_9PLEO|nr:hypothetical protein P154DRAFT_528755 [Amniculicola lignicola CBS 123094]